MQKIDDYYIIYLSYQVSVASEQWKSRNYANIHCFPLRMFSALDSNGFQHYAYKRYNNFSAST